MSLAALRAEAVRFWREDSGIALFILCMLLMIGLALRGAAEENFANIRLAAEQATECERRGGLPIFEDSLKRRLVGCAK